MLFYRPLFALFALGLTAVSASPVSNAVTNTPIVNVDKRADTNDVANILTTLKDTTDGILPKIQSMASEMSSNSSAREAFKPLFDQLNMALTTASSSLDSLGSVDTGSGPSASDVAGMVAPIVSDLGNTFGSAMNTMPSLGVLFPDVDMNLARVLRGLENVVAGVLGLVANLLADVAGLLRTLAFTFTLGVLGL